MKSAKWAILSLSLIILVNFGLYISFFFEVEPFSKAIKYISTNERQVGNYLDIFLFSILLVYLSIKKEAWIKEHKKQFNLVANTLFFIAIALTLVLVSNKFLIFDRPFFKFRYFTLYYVISFMPIIISLKYHNPINKILNFSILRKIGLYGFSIYLLHFAILQFVNSYVDLPNYLKLIITCSLIYFVSFTTYYLIEKPFIDLSYKIISKRNH